MGFDLVIILSFTNVLYCSFPVVLTYLTVLWTGGSAMLFVDNQKRSQRSSSMGFPSSSKTGLKSCLSDRWPSVVRCHFLFILYTSFLAFSHQPDHFRTSPHPSQRCKGFSVNSIFFLPCLLPCHCFVCVSDWWQWVKKYGLSSAQWIYPCQMGFVCRADFVVAVSHISDVTRPYLSQASPLP